MPKGTETDNTDGKQSKPWEFKKGESGNPSGRPKGAKNKLSEAFVYALHDDFVENGPEAIIETREKDPAGYLRVIASVIPKEINGNINHSYSEIENLTNEELESRLKEARSLLDGMRRTRRSGTSEEESPRTIQ